MGHYRHHKQPGSHPGNCSPLSILHYPVIGLTSSTATLPGIGPGISQKLSRLKISTVFDLLYHLPFRFEDRRSISACSACQPGEILTVKGLISAIKNERTHRGMFLQKAVITDNSGQLPVIWFNQLFLAKTLKAGTKVALYGKIDFSSRKISLINPEYEIISPDHPLIHQGRITPIYPETAGISSKLIRNKIFPLLFSAGLPEEIYFSPSNLPAWKTALINSHFPDHQDQTDIAKRRLSFDELLITQLLSLYHKTQWQHTRLSHPFAIDQELVSSLISGLPFTLTASQNTALKDILADLSKHHPMNRLLEGDVGSGKTVVAAIAAYVSYLNGFQTLFLAPTQILAHQHHATLSALFRPHHIEIGLVTGNSKLKIKNLKLKIIVGTHALLSPNLDTSNVGLVIIDEQHRFGVLQRALAASKGDSPHILTMTATPIPRTIALTLYGDLDLSLLTESPTGRLPVKTWVVPETKRQSAYAWIKNEISTHHTQVFVVCPFIDDSDTLTSVKAATTEFNRLKQEFSQVNLGLLHGRITSAQKTAVMDKFKTGEYQLLVTTPVVEVGIDIPNATIMLIEGAERFGLAQLHQLRGRVGRSHRQSYCLLFSQSQTDRLKAMETHISGLELAEIDLKIRGPGEIFGTSQHGYPEFKVADPLDADLVSQTHQLAKNLLPKLNQYPILNSLVEKDKISVISPN